MKKEFIIVFSDSHTSALWFLVPQRWSTPLGRPHRLSPHRPTSCNSVSPFAPQRFDTLCPLCVDIHPPDSHMTGSFSHSVSGQRSLPQRALPLCTQVTPPSHRPLHHLAVCSSWHLQSLKS